VTVGFGMVGGGVAAILLVVAGNTAGWAGLDTGNEGVQGGKQGRRTVEQKVGRW